MVVEIFMLATRHRVVDPFGSAARFELARGFSKLSAGLAGQDDGVI
jgi:hypothetical protein